MTARRTRLRASWLGLAVLCLAVPTLMAPIRTSAAEAPTFDAGTLTSTFPEPVQWSFVFRSGAAPQRVELLRRLPGTDATLVSQPGPGEVVQQPDGSWLVSGADERSVAPNTPYRLRLRVTTGDGVFLGPEAKLLVEDERFRWKVRESERLRLHWYEGSTDFAARALRVGEEGVTRAEEFLGVHLDSSVDMFVYADEAPFRDAIGPLSPENAAGVPFSSISTFFALIRPEQIDSSWVANVVPHELTHLVLQSAIGPGVALPLWLNEGLAVYLSTGNTPAYQRLVRDAIGDGRLLPLDGLTGNFPTTAQGDRDLIGYAEAVSAVDFMVRTYGQAKVAKLVDAFGGSGADDAFRTALGVDTVAFGDAWLRSIGADTPKRYGPRPAPSGPLPPDWLGPAPTAGLLGAETPGATPTPGASPPASPAPTSPVTGPGGAALPGALAVGLVVGLLVVAGLGVVAALRRRRGP